YQVEPTPNVEVYPERLTQTGCDRERQPARRKILEREPALGSVRIEKGDGRQWLIRYEMVIDHDHVDASVPQGRQAGVIGRPTVARDDQRWLGREHPRNRRVGQAVTPIEAIGQERRGTAAQRA